MDNNQLIKKDGDEAKKLLNNQFFQVHIWAAMNKLIDNRMLSVDTASSPQLSQDIIRYKQLLDEFQSIAIGAVKRAKAIEEADLKALERQRKRDEFNSKEPEIRR